MPEHGKRAARDAELERCCELEQRGVREGLAGWPADGVIRLGPDETSDIPFPGDRLQIDNSREVASEDQKVRVVLGPFSGFYLDTQFDGSGAGVEGMSVPPITSDQNDD